MSVNMNKQQLAAKIWATANKMRAKIEAHEYKDYILGFIFYKFLSENEVSYLKKELGWTDEEIKENLVETNVRLKRICWLNLGYFITYDNLFSTWLKIGNKFDVAKITDALSSFDTNKSQNPSHKVIFDDIFHELQTNGIGKLGKFSDVRELIKLINGIPMDRKQGYDVLGFVYEYLISNFAASAGKKAGEFYTPHEVCQLMSEIVANHLKDSKHDISIYDPTSGSGSLLITIGKSVSKYLPETTNIEYCAQEIKPNTYNLTRMNLVMHGIDPNNLRIHKGDTLKDDWPVDESDNTLPLRVDAVVSNPPYSQHWEPNFKKEGKKKTRLPDVRFDEYGYAPKAKADYAFLLHCLYHLKSEGIMTIVLPHGVLFRGKEGDGSEGDIRRTLIEKNYIDTIISLPASIFYGTGIPTIIMVLKKEKKDSNILFIDASRGFTKEGSKNKLRACDIKKIVDTISERKVEVPKYSRLVSKEEIQKNNYNLNIPRYIDSSEDVETWDIYATMFGGIPNSEIDSLKYWNTFPNLRNSLFSNTGTPYSQLTTTDVKEAVFSSPDVISYINLFSDAFSDINQTLKTKLIDNWNSVNIIRDEDNIGNDIFKRLKNIPLIDKYTAYQILDESWSTIAADLELMQNEEGFASVRKVVPNIITKKSENDEEEDSEVQDGWKGYILPFELVQKHLLSTQYQKYNEMIDHKNELEADISDIIASFSDDEMEGDYLNDSKDAFVSAKFKEQMNEIYNSIDDSPEISALEGYLSLLDSLGNNKADKAEKARYIENSPEVNWASIPQKSDGSYGKNGVAPYLDKVRREYEFAVDSFEAKMVKADRLRAELSEVKSTIKNLKEALDDEAKEKIENLSDDAVVSLLNLKWIVPLSAKLHKLPEDCANDLIKSVTHLSEKYMTTFEDVDTQLSLSMNELSEIIDKLSGNEYDIIGLSKLKSLAGGERKEIALDKMFSKDEENVPEIRINGFTGPWKPYLISDISEVGKAGGTPTSTNQSYYGGDIPFLSIADITKSGKYIRTTEKMITDKGLMNSAAWLVPKNSLIISMYASYGKVCINQRELATSQALYALTPKENYDLEFLYYCLSNLDYKAYWDKYINQGTQANLTAEILRNTKIMVPEKLSEQIMVSKCMKNMDILIENTLNMHNKLLSMKKALLEKMFV